MNKAKLISRLDGLSSGVLPNHKMHGFYHCAADTSDVFRVGYRTLYCGVPSLVEVRRGYSFNRVDLISDTCDSEYPDVLFQLFRSYSTYCAVSVVTHTSAYVLVTHAPTATTRMQLAKYVKDISATSSGFRLNLYKDSRATICDSFRYFLPDAIRFDIDSTISTERSNSHTLYAIYSKWEQYFTRENPPIFTPDLAKALGMIFGYAYGVGVDDIGLSLPG